jgi:hypothetical protein
MGTLGGMHGSRTTFPPLETDCVSGSNPKYNCSINHTEHHRDKTTLIM